MTTPLATAYIPNDYDLHQIPLWRMIYGAGTIRKNNIVDLMLYYSNSSTGYPGFVDYWDPH